MAKSDSQQTIQSEITITGKGLMLGESVTLTLKPASADFGVVFRRVDIVGGPGGEGMSRKLGRYSAAMHQLTQR